MKSRVGTAIVCLHIAAALYVLAGFGMGFAGLFLIAEIEDLAIVSRVFLLVLAGLSLLLAVGAEVVAWGLRRRKLWAWIFGLVLFVVYIPSVLIVLGAIGIWSLLVPGTRREFGVGGPIERSSSASPPSPPGPVSATPTGPMSEVQPGP